MDILKLAAPIECLLDKTACVRIYYSTQTMIDVSEVFDICEPQ